MTPHEPAAPAAPAAGTGKIPRPNTYVGAPVERVEDLRFLRGRGTYVDDLRRSG
jgi:hypothetical protein